MRGLLPVYFLHALCGGVSARFPSKFKEPLQNRLRGQIAALHGAHLLAVYRILSRSLRAVRLALHPARLVLQGFHKKTIRDLCTKQLNIRALVGFHF